MDLLTQLIMNGELNQVSTESRGTWLESILGNIKDDGKLNSHFDVRGLDEASYLLRAHEKEGAKVISGGTDILRMMKWKYTSPLPHVLLNIKTIPDLTYIKEENGVLKLGALTCLSDIETSALIRANYGILAEAASVVGTPQVRNMATIAGSICQNPSCWYYRAAANYFPCLMKGGADCPAVNGDNRWMFSILGTPEAFGCYATCQSDMAIVLSSLGASVKTTQRTIPMGQFYTLTAPRNVLTPDEIITEIQVPALCADARAKYTKFRIRESFDHPLISVAGVASGTEVKIVLGGVFGTPYHVTEAEDIVRGRKISKSSAEKAGEMAVQNARSMSMNEWKVEVTKVLVKRTLLALG